MKDMFNKISEGVTKNMTEEEIAKFRDAHGTKKVGPPLKCFKKWQSCCTYAQQGFGKKGGSVLN